MSQDEPNPVTVTAIALVGLLLTSSIAPRDEPAPVTLTEIRTAGDLVVAHTITVSRADDLPGLEQLDMLRYADRGELSPCR